MRKLIIKFLGLKVEDVAIGLFLMIVLFFATLLLLKLEYLIDLINLINHFLDFLNKVCSYIEQTDEKSKIYLYYVFQVYS